MIAFVSWVWRHARAAAIALLFAIPLLVLWNLVAGQFAPRWALRVARLTGVTTSPAPLQWSWRALTDGELQAAAARAVGEALPLRPLMIRINNEIRYTLFGAIGPPDIIEGEQGQLFERYTLEEYCGRGSDTAELRAEGLIPKLRDIQSYFTARERIFLYILTPSKAAHLAEDFPRTFSCNSSIQDRTMKLPVLVRLLREAGINVLDTASLVHGLKGTERVDFFVRGGVHWDALATAYAAAAIVGELDRLGVRPPIPPLLWHYEVVNRARDVDSDLADLMNLLVPRVRYPVPKVTFQGSASCEDQPSKRLNIALIGDSFSEGLADALRSGACLSQLYIYRYLTVRHGGPDDSWKMTPDESDIAPIRDASVVILEENEGFAAEANYVSRLRALLAQR